LIRKQTFLHEKVKKQKVEAVATMVSKYISYIMADADEEETFIYIGHQIVGSAV